MNVIIAGAGEVGRHAAEVLSGSAHNVTIIDLDENRLRQLGDTLDVRTLEGHCAHFDVLIEAGAARCDLMIAATNVDEINLLSASMAKAVGAKSTIVRVHHTANYSLRGTRYAAQLGIDELICPEHLTAMAIARAVRNPGLIAIEEFAEGQMLMQRFPVDEDARGAGKRLSEIQLPQGTRVATVDRDGVARMADAGTVIDSGDFVTLVGEIETFDAARRLFSKTHEHRLHVAIMGETSTAVWLCRAFRAKTSSVRVFVENHERAEELAEKLPHVTVLEADPTDASTFAEEHLERADVFIAATEEDERNLLACAQAKRLGVASVITVVQRAKYLHLLPHVGIDHAFSPRADAVRAILHLLQTGPVRSLATFAGDVAEVYEVTPTRQAPILGHELRNIRMPPLSMIAAIRRSDRVRVPGADDQVLAGDAVLVIGPRGIKPELTELFVKK